MGEDGWRKGVDSFTVCDLPDRPGREFRLENLVRAGPVRGEDQLAVVRSERPVQEVSRVADRGIGRHLMDAGACHRVEVSGVLAGPDSRLDHVSQYVTDSSQTDRA